MAIGADGRLRNPFGEGLAVNAGAELIGDIAVAHAAGIGHLLAELGGLGTQQLMGGAVTNAAIRRGAVSAFGGLAMDAAIVVGLLSLVALAASRLRHVCRMGIFIMLHMTGGAGHGGMGAFGELSPLIVVAGRASRVVRGTRG